MDKRKLARAEVLLDDLLEDPELFFDEGERLVRSVDRRALRTVVVDRLRERFTQLEMMIMVHVLRMIGIGKSKGDLARLVSDPAQRYDSRAAAASILLESDVRFGARVLSRLDPEDRASLEEYPFRLLIRTQIESPSEGGPFSDVLLPPDEDADPLEHFRRVEAVRVKMGVFPTALYDDAIFAEERLEVLREPVIEVMIEERDPGAVYLFERMLEESSDEEERRRWRKAIIRLGTARSEHVPQSPHARAWIIPPEVVSAGSIALLIRNPDGTSTLSIFQLDPEVPADPDQRHGFIDHDSAEESVGALEERSFGPITPISPGMARTLVDRYVEGLGEGWLSEPDPAIMGRVLQAWRIRGPEPLPKLEPAVELKKKDVAELMERQPYGRWTFDPDLIAWDAIEDDAIDEWKKRAIELLDQEDIERERIVRNLDWMALFHLLSGDQFSAGLAARLAREIEAKRSMRVAGFAERLIENTLEMMAELDTQEWDEELEGDEPDLGELPESVLEKVVESLLPEIDKQLGREGGEPAVRAAYDRLTRSGSSAAEAKETIAALLASHLLSSSEEAVIDFDDYYRDLDRL